MVADFEEHKAVKFDLKKDEITGDAVAQIDKLSEKNCYVPMARFEEVLKENKWLRNELKKVTGDFWITVSAAMNLTGLKAQAIYKLMETGQITSIGEPYRKRISRFEILQKKKELENGRKYFY